MYIDHPGVWKPENPDATVWRYMSLAKYYALLSKRSFYLSNVSLFSDRLEGKIPTPTLSNEQIINERLRTQQPTIMPFDDMVKYRNEFRRLSFALCWNEREHESIGLWRQYTNECDGVAIKSTVAALKTIGENIDDPIYLGKVKYVDYPQGAPDLQLFSSLVYPVLLKSNPYIDENEIRVLCCDWPRISNLMSDGKLNDAAFGVDIGAGIHIDIDPASLITECRVPPNSPLWYLELIKQMTVDLGYPTILVASSEIDTTISEDLVQ